MGFSFFKLTLKFIAIQCLSDCFVQDDIIVKCMVRRRADVNFLRAIKRVAGERSNVWRVAAPTWDAW